VDSKSRNYEEVGRAGLKSSYNSRVPLYKNTRESTVPRQRRNEQVICNLSKEVQRLLLVVRSYEKGSRQAQRIAKTYATRH